MDIPTPTDVQARLSTGGDLLERCVEALGEARKLPTAVATNGASRDQVAHVTKTLARKGWRVRFCADWRDGNYLELSPFSAST